MEDERQEGPAQYRGLQRLWCHARNEAVLAENENQTVYVEQAALRSSPRA